MHSWPHQEVPKFLLNKNSVVWWLRHWTANLYEHTHAHTCIHTCALMHTRSSAPTHTHSLTHKQTHMCTCACTHTSFFHFHGRWVWVLNATPWPLTPKKKSRTHGIGWDLQQVWTAAEILVQARIQSPDSPACSESLLLCRHDGSLEEKSGEESEKRERQHSVMPGLKVCYSDQTATHTLSFWH